MPIYCVFAADSLAGAASRKTVVTVTETATQGKSSSSGSATLGVHKVCLRDQLIACCICFVYQRSIAVTVCAQGNLVECEWMHTALQPCHALQ